MPHLIALRVDEVGNNETLAIFTDILKSETDCYLISKETSKEVKKIHYHAQVSIESHLKIETIKKCFRTKIKELLGLKSSKQFYVQTVKDIKKHTTYIMKELEVCVNNWNDQEFIEDCLEETQRINIEKKLKMKHQLLIYAEEVLYVDLTDPAEVNINDLFIQIIHYHIERDYLPPSRTLLTQYAAFVVSKMLGNCKIANLYLLEIYKI